MGKKTLSPRTVPEKTTIRLPRELYLWVKEKAEKENKSISLVITEILQEAKEREG